jgi:LysR family hydrogen peroxide-inducible transcriptional activator
MISFKQLRYFEAVARTRHFGKAAEQCAVTQPALSMQIQELEKTLGVQLIERGRHGVLLTEAGREIAGRASRILADTRDIVDFARRQGSVLAGPLHLGVIPSVAPYVLPALLPLIRENFPISICTCARPGLIISSRNCWTEGSISCCWRCRWRIRKSKP